jgi:uncharacterized LabA/DUF88 family protein
MTASQVEIFIDYQNLHLSAGEAFAPPGTPAHTMLIHPAKFADVLMQRRASYSRTGQIQAIHVYRGQPSSAKESHAAARNKAQAAHWSRDRRVTMHTRTLRYPRNWPQDKAKEKGVDVKLACDFVRCALINRADTLILVSRDTDLVPALEMARDFARVDIEVAMWQGCSRLRLPKTQLWCTQLDGVDYLNSKDHKQY